jgi:hypothetical protein
MGYFKSLGEVTSTSALESYFVRHSAIQIFNISFKENREGDPTGIS